MFWNFEDFRDSRHASDRRDFWDSEWVLDLILDNTTTAGNIMYR